MLLMYRFGCRRSGNFFHGTLQIYEGEKVDAGKELTHAVGTSREEYCRKRLVAVKNATAGGTIYYSKKFNNEAVEIRWQANALRDGVIDRDPDGLWYAPTVETYWRHDCLKVIQHIQKRLKKMGELTPLSEADITPRRILSSLAEDELIFVRYDSSNYDVWLPLQGEPEHIDRAPVEIPA